MDLEKIATSAIVSSISKTDTLSGFINDGDKEPCWDGNIYIHENSRHSKKNIKRIPTQVKGKAVKTKSVKDKIKYRVKYDDLKAYMMDGGTLFFVVYIEKETGEALQIYYADLLPIRIMKILEQTQDSYSIDFFSFPSDNKEKIEVVLNAFLTLACNDTMDKYRVSHKINSTLKTYRLDSYFFSYYPKDI